MIVPFFKGGLVGFSIAAVVGPIGILCLKRSFSSGFASGIAIGLGAALADTIFGAIAFLGLSSISSFLLEYAYVTRFLGGLFLFYLGYKIYYTAPDLEHDGTRTTSYGYDVLTTFLLTLTSPVTILAFISLFSALGVIVLSFVESLVAIVGVFCGSMLWWVLISLFGSMMRLRLNSSLVSIVNTLSGLFIASFGVISLIQVILHVYSSIS